MIDDDLLKTVKDKNIVVPFSSSKVGQSTIKLTLDNNIQLYVTERPIKSSREYPEKDYKTVDISSKEFYVKPGESVSINQLKRFVSPKTWLQVFMMKCLRICLDWK